MRRQVTASAIGSSWSRRGRLLCVGLVAVAAILASASTAFAARSYVSQLTAANGNAFSSPYGLAVDGSDNLWVSDTGTALVSKFDSSGNYLAQNDGTGSWNGSPYIQDLAFGDSASLIYAVDSNFDDLWGLNLDATAAGVDLNSGLGGGCCFIRADVDNSGGATDGDIYVASGGAVTRIDGTGAAADFSGTASYISGNQLTGTPAHAFAGFAGVAVDASGNVYVADSGNNEVDEFDATGIFVQAFTGSFGSISAVAVDPTNGEVLIGDAALGVVHGFDSGGAFVDDIDGSGTPDGSFTPWGLAVDSNGTLYVADAAHPVVDAFGPADPLPPRHQIAASKTGSGTGTVTSSPAGLDCGATCTHNFDDNSTVTFTATPDVHNTFTGWTVDGDANACPGTGTCDVPVGTSDHTVVANFDAVPHYALSVTSDGSGSVRGPGINCPTDCAQGFYQGSAISVSARPAQHHHFVGWSGDCSGTGACDLTMDAAHDVTATFAIDTHAVDVTKAGTGSGTVTSDVGVIDCGSTCSDSYDHGTVVTLTAVAASGSTFVGWSGDCSGTGACHVTVDAASNVTARFDANPPKPPTDTDGDGVPDSTDHCPTKAGPASNHGCPVVTPTHPGGSGEAAGKLTVIGTAKVKGGRALVKVTCDGAAGAAACQGELQLVARVKVGKQTKTRVIGTASYGPIAVGDDATVKVKLSGPAKRILARIGKLRAKVQRVGGSKLTDEGGTIVLKRGQAKKHRK